MRLAESARRASKSKRGIRRMIPPMEVIETGPEPQHGKSTPEFLRKQEPYWRTSTAAVGARITAVKLFDVELGRRKCPARTGLPGFRTKIAFVGRISAPFAEAAP